MSSKLPCLLDESEHPQGEEGTKHTKKESQKNLGQVRKSDEKAGKTPEKKHAVSSASSGNNWWERSGNNWSSGNNCSSAASSSSNNWSRSWSGSDWNSSSRNQTRTRERKGAQSNNNPPMSGNNNPNPRRLAPWAAAAQVHHLQPPPLVNAAAPDPANNPPAPVEGPPAAAAAPFHYVDAGDDEGVDPEVDDGRMRWPRLKRSVVNLRTPNAPAHTLQKLRRHPVTGHRINRVLDGENSGELEENDSDISDCEQLQISRMRRPALPARPRILMISDSTLQIGESQRYPQFREWSRQFDIKYNGISGGKVCGEKGGSYFTEMKTFLQKHCAEPAPPPDLCVVVFGGNCFKGKKQSIADLEPGYGYGARDDWISRRFTEFQQICRSRNPYCEFVVVQVGCWELFGKGYDASKNGGEEEARRKLHLCYANYFYAVGKAGWHYHWWPARKLSSHLTSDGWHFYGSAQKFLYAKLLEIINLYLQQ